MTTATSTTCATTGSTSPITIVRGESKTFQVTVKDKNKTNVDLTGSKVWFTVKERIEDVTPVISKRNLAAGGSNAQIEILLPQTNGNKGKLNIYLVPSDTACLKTDHSYVFDVWVELTSGKRYQVIKKRTFIIEEAVTTVFI
jgi:hypothetical protein